MKGLRELVKLIDGNKLKFLSIYDYSDKTSQTGRLYHALLKSNIEIDDQTLSLMIYGQSDSKNRLRQVKYQLKKKLINSIFLINTNQLSFNDVNKAYSEAYRIFAAIQLLSQNQAYTISSSLAEHLIPITIKY